MARTRANQQVVVRKEVASRANSAPSKQQIKAANAPGKQARARERRRLEQEQHALKVTEEARALRAKEDEQQAAYQLRQLRADLAAISSVAYAPDDSGIKRGVFWYDHLIGRAMAGTFEPMDLLASTTMEDMLERDAQRRETL